MMDSFDKRLNTDVPLIVYGGGGHGHVVVDAAKASGREVSAVLDDKTEVKDVCGVRVFRRDDSRWQTSGSWQFIIAVGRNSVRAKLYSDLGKEGGFPAIVIHPAAVLSPYAFVGDGTVAFAGVVVNPGVRVGENSILNTGCSVDHDCQIGAHVQLCPGVRLAGNVVIGDRTFVGTGATVVPGVKVGSECEIGAGSVVLNDVPAGMMACGVPARIVRKSDV